ncbi:hypothetical protein Tco_0572994 [Tanacetum coccineum]
MFIKYSIGQILLKKSRGKGSQGKKTSNTLVTDVDVSKEFEPKPAKKRTTNVALELGKSISLTDVEEAEAARQVHATHAKIVTESVPKLARIITSSKVTSDPPKKLKSVLSLTLEKQVAANIIKALKESKKPGEDNQVLKAQMKELVANHGFPMSPQTSLPPQVKELVEYSEEDLFGDEEKDDKDGDADDEGDDHVSDTQDADDADAETESDEDEIYKYKIHVRKDKDEEMSDAEVVGSDKGDEEVTDTAKADAEKASEVKDDAKKTELPPTSSSLSVSSGFGDQFLKTSSDTFLIGTVKDTTNVEINSLMDIKIQSEVPQIQSQSVPRVPVFVIVESLVLTPIPETPSAITVTTLPPLFFSTIPPVPLQQQTIAPILTPPITTDAPTVATVVPESNALTAVELRVAKLEKDVSGLKTIDLSAEAFAALKTQVPTVVDDYLGSKVGDIFQKELQKHTAYLIQKYSLTQALESSKIKTPTINLEQESEKIPSEILKIKKEQSEK